MDEESDIPDESEEAAEAFDPDFQGFIDPLDQEAVDDQTKSAFNEQILSLRTEIDQLKNELSQLARPLNRAFVAKITGAAAWDERAYSSGAWTTYADGRTGAAALVEMKNDPAGTMTLVIEDRDNGSMVYVRVPMLGTPVYVTLTSTGGSGGDQTTAPSFVYTATTLAGDPVGTSMSPDASTRRKGKFSAATLGVGYFGADGIFVLVQAFEPPGTSGCSGGG